MKEQQAEARAKWRGLIAEQQQSGKSVAGFCQERGLGTGQFYEWKKRLRETGPVPFVEVAVKPAARAVVAQVGPGSAIEVQLKSGHRLVVGPGFDAQHLRALLGVLESEA
ncbi:MAG TPA: hypothetical protein VKV02_11705 [Acidobacteriaceae bacterium]|nr:hypothetical protein [Acidobacteriaceae bacterium]